MAGWQIYVRDNGAALILVLTVVAAILVYYNRYAFFASVGPHGTAAERRLESRSGGSTSALWLAVIAAGAAVAAAIAVTNRWEVVAAPPGAVFSTVRVDRWTGKMQICTISLQTGGESPLAAGNEFICERRP